MKSNKKTMIAAALAVAVVALAGVGYAAITSYKAVTTNENNSLESAYIELTQSGAGAYSTDLFTKLYFDTLNTGTSASNNTTVYTPNCDLDCTAAGVITDGDDFALVSKELNLIIKEVNTGRETADLEVTVTNFAPITGLTYALVLVDGSTTYRADYSGYVAATDTAPAVPGKWTFTNPINIAPASGHNDVTYSVKLLIGLASGSEYVEDTDPSTIGTAGFGTSTNPSVFTFTVTGTVPTS